MIQTIQKKVINNQMFTDHIWMILITQLININLSIIIEQIILI